MVYNKKYNTEMQCYATNMAQLFGDTQTKTVHTTILCSASPPCLSANK